MNASQIKFLSNIQTAAEIIRASENTVVLTGAGISTPSGIPDFRRSNQTIPEHDVPQAIGFW